MAKIDPVSFTLLPKLICTVCYNHFALRRFVSEFAHPLNKIQIADCNRFRPIIFSREPPQISQAAGRTAATS